MEPCAEGCYDICCRTLVNGASHPTIDNPAASRRHVGALEHAMRDVLDPRWSALDAGEQVQLGISKWIDIAGVER